MLEAYLRERSLKEIEDRLPENAEQATEELGRFLEERSDDTRALFILARSQLLLEKTDARDLADAQTGTRVSSGRAGESPYPGR